MSNFDSFWDRNFQYLTEEELNLDYDLKDELQIQWSAEKYLKPQTCDYLIMATNRAYHLFHCLFSSPISKKNIKTQQKQKIYGKDLIFNSKPIAKITVLSKSKPKKQQQQQK